MLYFFFKVKVVQNGKLNGNTSNKNQVSISSKKKESEKFLSADKPSAEKSQSEKKVVHVLYLCVMRHANGECTCD